jgi:Zn-dependent M16 (insulinase) family peptidase
MKPSFGKSGKYKNFSYEKISDLSEINCVFYLLEHTPTGAKVIHIEADDPENVFCLSFRTYPDSDNGAPHILEHTVLCGSKSYPVKDPFFSMTRRSLSTFMNAMTGSDTTFYPAASQVEKDFYNLLSVYIDAVFFPELKELSFLQEGHRLEFEKPDDPKSPLVIKGIVFNEMKGSLNNAETRLQHALQKAIFPDLFYKYNSGGEPLAITELTYEGLKAFHKKYYHPSKCLFYFYGNLDLEQHLDFIEEKILSKSEKSPPLPKIKKQPRHKKRQHLKGSYPANGDSEEDKSFIAFGWLTVPTTNIIDSFALLLLDSILMDTDASPLKEAIQESGLTPQADGMIDTEMSEVPYLIICRGCNPDCADAIEKIIFKKLKEIAKKGIDTKKIEAAMHQFELSRIEISKDHGPYGLTLFFRAGLHLQHGGDPEDMLKVHSLFDRLKEKLQDAQYLPNLIKEHFIDNPHFIRLVFSPDSDLAEEEEKEIEKKLKELKKNLTDAKKKEIIETSRKLSEFQEKELDISCLPQLAISDIPKETQHFPIKYEGVHQMGLFTYTAFTNDVTYADIIFDLFDTPIEDLHYLKLFTSIITEVGSGIRSYKENLEFIQAFTGGLSASISLNPLYDKPTILRPTLSLHSRALGRFNDHLFTLLKDTILLPNLDLKERIKELITQIYTLLSDKINRSAMGYATKAALSPFSEHNFIINQMSGLPYFEFIRDLATNIDEKLPIVMKKLQAIKEKLFHLNNPHLVLSCDKASLDHIRAKDFYKIPRIPSSPFSPFSRQFKLPSEGSFGKIIASPVAFTAKAYPVFGYTHPLCAALMLASYIMENKVLHKRIREQGGAYGSGATYQPATCDFYFYAYRDPNLDATLKAFDFAIEEIKKGNFDAQDLIEAKLGLIQDIDVPLSVGARGIVTYMQERKGRTKEVKQAFRNEILKVEKKEVMESVTQAFLDKESFSSLSVYASSEFFEKEKLAIPLDISNI